MRHFLRGNEAPNQYEQTRVFPYYPSGQIQRNRGFTRIPRRARNALPTYEIPSTLRWRYGRSRGHVQATFSRPLDDVHNKQPKRYWPLAGDSISSPANLQATIPLVSLPRHGLKPLRFQGTVILRARTHSFARKGENMQHSCNEHQNEKNRCIRRYVKHDNVSLRSWKCVMELLKRDNKQ